jgi:hypothetical protein
MKTVNLKKQFKQLYQPSAKKVETIKIPKLSFAMIDGAIEKGSEPGKSPGFARATEALYSVAYTLKFMIKKRAKNPADYPVMPLEGLWWVEDGFFDITVKDNWFYTLMILTPEIVTQAGFKEARTRAAEKKTGNPLIGKVRLAHFNEGLCVQTMHIGPYATEPATMEKMRVHMEENRLEDRVGPKGGKHHEIYISDPRKAKPEKMKTILRHPVAKLSS